MSAIAGIIGFQGRPVARGDLSRMLSVMRRRGPDAIGVHVEGSVGLGQAMLRTTPESLTEVLPNRFGHDQLVITADARVDNRDELVRLLGIPAASATGCPDSELILKAFARQGVEALDHLLGDFAFAIYDERRKLLTLACDPFGVRQVYYVQGPDFFAFASEIKALLALEEVSSELDDEAVVAYFLPELVDAERTVYASIRRLLPGHFMEVGPDGIRVRKYFELEQETVPQDRGDDWYAAAFLERFQAAVQRRLRSAYPIGAEVSGGLDSSFVACAAADLLDASGTGPLDAFSNVYDHVRECDERPFIQEVLLAKNLRPHFVPADARPHEETLREILGAVDDWRLSGQHQLVWNTARAAGESGTRVLLTGHDGDTTVGHGLELFYEWARAGNWKEFAQGAKQYVAHLASEEPTYARNPWHGVRVNDIANGYVRDYLATWLDEGQYGRLASAAFNLNRRIGLPLKPIPGYLYNRRRVERLGNVEMQTQASILRPELIEKYNVLERLQQHAEMMQGDAWRSARSSQKLMFGMPQVALNLKTLAEYGGAWGVEMRHPFMDRRLIEFCLGMPATQSFRGGRTRAVMRDAMRGIVPDRVASRPGKTDLSPLFQYLWRDLGGLLRSIPATSSQFLDRWVNRERLTQLAEMHPKLPSREVAQLAAYATIGIWQGAHKDMEPSSGGTIRMGWSLSATPDHGSIIMLST